MAWFVPMIRIALFGFVILIVLGAIAILADLLVNLGDTANQSIASRFPEGWESAPVVEYKKQLPQPPAIPLMSSGEFIAAVTAVEQLRLPSRPPQPADALLNDAQIASMKARLELTKEQEPYWQKVEASLREVVWDRSRRDRPILEPGSLKRFTEAALPFVATLNPKQRSEIQALAKVVGLRLTPEDR